MEEFILLLRENNKMLKEILAYIRLVQSDNEITKEHLNQFALNVLADIFVENMSEKLKTEINKDISR